MADLAFLRTMGRSAIAELSSSRNGACVAAGFAETIIQIWDLETRLKTVELSTIFRFGSQNLALGVAGELLIATDTDSSGHLAGYDIPSGEVLWKRTRVPSPAQPTFSESGDRFWYSALDSQTAECVESKTGKTLERIRKAKRYIEGPYGTSLLIPWEQSSPYVLIGEHGRKQIDRLSFGMLAISFAPDCIFISEAAGAIRCLNYVDGGLRWTFCPESGSHAMNLYYNSTNELLYAVIWQFEQGLFRRLIKFDPRTGRAEFVRDLKSWMGCFIPVREQFLTQDGLIIDLEKNEMVSSLAFPVISL